MKKLLLSAAAIIIAASSFGQLQIKSNLANWGFTGSIVKGDSLRAFELTFDTDSTVYKYATTQSNRGLFATPLTYGQVPGTTTYFNSGRGLNINNKKLQQTGANGNPFKFRSVQELIDTCNVKPMPSPYNYNDSWEAWKSSAVIFQNSRNTESPVTNDVFAAYPGFYKNNLMGFRINLKGTIVDSDISFDILTYSRGNLVNASGVAQFPSIKYKMIVTTTGATLEGYKATYFDTIKVGNGTDIFVVENIYETATAEGDQKVQTINVFEKIGKEKSFFNNKEVSVMLYTTGTLGLYPILPGVYHDPFIAIDNLKGDYIMPAFATPAFIPQESGSNWRPEIVIGNDTLSIPRNEEWQSVKFKLATKNRVGALSLTEKARSGNVYFPETGAVKAKGLSGEYDVDVTATITNSTPGGTVEDKLTIAAPEQGTSANDDLEITVLVRGTSLDVEGIVRNVTYEISNGNAYEINYNLRYKGVDATSVNPAPANVISVISADKKVRVMNADSQVQLINASGQLVKTATATEAAKGITATTGVYIVKSGEFTQKVVVQ